MSQSGPTPFGYQRKHDRFVPHPEESKIRVLIYDLFIEHQRKKTVAEILNAEGYRTRTGAFFSGPTISRLLSDPRVVGIPHEVDAIIGREIFEKCEAILQSQKTKGVSRKARHVFAGICFCRCGGKMLVRSKSDKYTCTNCKDKIYASDLEAIFVEQLRASGINQFKELSRKWQGLSLEEKISVVSITTKKVDVDSQNSKITVTFLDI